MSILKRVIFILFVIFFLKSLVFAEPQPKGKFTGKGIGGGNIKGGDDCLGGQGRGTFYSFHPISCALDPSVVRTKNRTANGVDLGLVGQTSRDSLAMPLRCRGQIGKKGQVFRLQVDDKCLLVRQDDWGTIPKAKVDLTGNIARYLMTGRDSQNCTITKIKQFGGEIRNVKYFLDKSVDPKIIPKGGFIKCGDGQSV